MSRIYPSSADSVIFQSDFTRRSTAGLSLQDCDNSINPGTLLWVPDPLDSNRWVKQHTVNRQMQKLSGSFRSEVKYIQSNGLYTFGGAGWTYRFSVYLPDGYEIDTPPDGITQSEEALFQIHNTPDLTDYSHPSPPFALVTDLGNFRLNGRYEPDDPTTQNGKTFIQDLFAWETGVWYHFTLYIVWAADTTGQLYLYCNGEELYTRLNLPNTYDDEVGGYVKEGIYKWDWNDRPTASSVSERIVLNDILGVHNRDTRFDKRFRPI